MFEIHAKDGRARTGFLCTAHGKLKTPFYMPVCTKAAAKDLTPEELEACGIRSIISNGMLLGLRPGADLISAHGGIHSFMHWNGGVFTDSGGFQILSDDFLIKKSDEGILFKNPYDGQTLLLRPEDSIAWQHKIGSDVAMMLDDVPRYGVSKDEARDSLARTTAWLQRNIQAHQEGKKVNPGQMLFGIGQGGIYEDLRQESAETLVTSEVDGFAIGGLAIGEPPAKMFHAIDIQTRIFEKVPHKARYVMGLGSPADLVNAVALGCDIFDSIFPTQNARRGSLFTNNGTLRIENAPYRHDLSPVDEDCTCYTCKNYTRAYLHSMLRLKERIGLKLASIHNIHFVQHLLDRCADAIKDNSFEEFRRQFLQSYDG